MKVKCSIGYWFLERMVFVAYGHKTEFSWTEWWKRLEDVSGPSFWLFWHASHDRVWDTPELLWTMKRLWNITDVDLFLSCLARRYFKAGAQVEMLDWKALSHVEIASSSSHSFSFATQFDYHAITLNMFSDCQTKNCLMSLEHTRLLK